MLVAKMIITDQPRGGRAHPAPTGRFRAAEVARGPNVVTSLNIDASMGTDAGLTTIEMATIVLAHRDPVSSIKPRSWLFRVLFGARNRLELANPKLEALRRYVVLFRLDGSSPDEVRRVLADAGYADRLIEEINGRITLPSNEERPWRRLDRPRHSSTDRTAGDR